MGIHWLREGIYTHYRRAAHNYQIFYVQVLVPVNMVRPLTSIKINPMRVLETVHRSHPLAKCFSKVTHYRKAMLAIIKCMQFLSLKQLVKQTILIVVNVGILSSLRYVEPCLKGVAEIGLSSRNTIKPSPPSVIHLAY